MPSEKRDTLRESLASDLRSLDERAQLRSLDLPRGINLCSNDYLGLSAHPSLRQALMDAVEQTPRLSSTGSRLLSGQAPEWEELEREFADFAGTEAALYFTSGYAANLGVLSSVLRRGDLAFSDRLNHASLIDGIRLSGAEKVIYPHADLDALESALRHHRDSAGRKVIVTESVFSMEGDIAPLAEMQELAERYGAELVVDEAHATGVQGPQGRGVVAGMGLERRVFATVHPCGKALAAMGGFVCGSVTLKQYLVNSARSFIFSTALPAYFAAQLHASLGLVRAADRERATLLNAASGSRRSLRETGFDTGASRTQIIPVVLGENSAALCMAAALQREGFGVRAIRPPSVPEGKARLRFSLTCGLRAEDLARLRDALVAARDRLTAAAAAK